ncbi:hypothetical protein [Streptomyces sp. NBC_01262]|uniref:hypothetical protein n=1 Tax=Streptomyces sp. NBC_01262 TaxID=2903803 RepID=UPI002E316D41|nr:hypothetical protein [Streptomyces sp. NBC_01262]
MHYPPRLVLTVLAATAALLVAGCGAGTEATVASSPSPSVSVSKASRALTVKQLAAAVGCTAKITSKAADYRQATCKVSGVEHVFLDFDTAAGQRAWLDYAEMYGGVYLVGNRWVLSAKSKEYMQTLSAKLGGTVEEQGAYGSSPAPSSS